MRTFYVRQSFQSFTNMGLGKSRVFPKECEFKKRQTIHKIGFIPFRKDNKVSLKRTNVLVKHCGHFFFFDCIWQKNLICFGYQRQGNKILLWICVPDICQTMFSFGSFIRNNIFFSMLKIVELHKAWEINYNVFRHNLYYKRNFSCRALT